MQWFLGGGAKKIIGANNVYDIRVLGHPRCVRGTSRAARAARGEGVGGGINAKSAPPGAISPQNVPHIGHFLRKMCPTWGTLRDSAGHPWPGGGANAPIAPPLYPPLFYKFQCRWCEHISSHFEFTLKDLHFIKKWEMKSFELFMYTKCFRNKWDILEEASSSA